MDEAKALHEEALSLQEGLGENADRVATLRILGDVAIEQGDLIEAARRGEAALAQARALGERPEEAAAHYLLAVVADHQQQWTAAQEHGQRALTILEQVGDRGFQSSVLFQLSQIAYKQGDYVTAEAFIGHGVYSQNGHDLTRLAYSITTANHCVLHCRPNHSDFPFRRFWLQ